MTSKTHDFIAIGSGPAGGSAAKAAAANGHSVAIIEADRLGGTCLNYGCDPTKTILDAAHAYARARDAEQHGFQVDQARLEWGQVSQRAHEVIREIRGGSHQDAVERQRSRGIEVIQGEASFRSPRCLQVGDRLLESDRILIATGASAQVPPIDGLETTGFVTNVEVLSEWEEPPERLAIIGAGPVSVEFAQMLCRAGVEVTVFEVGSRIMIHDDCELAEALQKTLAGHGLRFILEADLQRIERHGESKRLHLGGEDEDSTFVEVDEILVAAGRQPNTERLNLAAAGVDLAEAGCIQVDACLRTSASGVFAAGDVACPEHAYTHVASPQGKLAAENAFSSDPQPFDFGAIPHCTYTDPALAAIGLTEEALQESGRDYRVGRVKMADLPRGKMAGETDGLYKVLTSPDGDLLGVHILAVHAGDLLAPAVLAMQAKLPVQTLADAMFPYPTFGEGLSIAAGQAADG